MLTQEEFGKILKFINTANNNLDVLLVSKEVPEHHKEWMRYAQDELGKLTDYLVDEVKIEEETK